MMRPAPAASASPASGSCGPPRPKPSASPPEAKAGCPLSDGERTVFQSLEDAFPQAGQAPPRALAGCFGFSGDEIEKKCRVLSGGEKARLVMATMLFDPPNFLVLDKQTNHLDMATTKC